MLRTPLRPARAVDRWTGARWRLLEHHCIDIHPAPRAGAALDVSLEALAQTRIGDMPAVVGLFALRGLRFSKEMTLRQFFSTAPFVLLEEQRGGELVFGVLLPASGPEGRRPPRSPAEFRQALVAAPFAAVGSFGVEPIPGGARLWTETWAATNGAAARLLFGAYWLAIGPWSAWIRRMILRAARARAER